MCCDSEVRICPLLVWLLIAVWLDCVTWYCGVLYQRGEVMSSVGLGFCTDVFGISHLVLHRVAAVK